MRRVLAWLMGMSCACGSVSSSAQTTTLEDVVRLALTRNERSRVADLTVVTADAAVSRARAGFLPTIVAGGSETFRPFPPDTNGRATNAVRSATANGTLTITQPIVSVPAFPLYSAAKSAREAARFDALNQRRQLSFDAARAFFGAIAQQGLLTAARRRLERADASFNDTRARAEAQFVSTNDVTRARIERAAATQSVANAQGSLQQARVNLEYLLNAAIAGDLIPPDRVLATLTLPVPQLIKQALTQRPDLGASREGVAAANSQADEPGLRFVPTLNAAGQGRISDQAIAGDRYLDATVALNLAWNIWDAGVRSADADSRRAAAQTLDWQMRLLRRRVSADVQAAVATVTATRTALQASGEAVEAARQSAEETSILYKQGLAKAIELVNANLSRFDAEVSLAAAQLALRQAELDLRAALGLFPIDGVK